MRLTNNKIYNYASALAEAFNDPDFRLPVKVNFYLSKNKMTLVELAKDIEKARTEIIRNFSILNEDTNQYEVPTDKTDEAMKEINELFNLEQDVNIYTIKFEDIGEKMMMSTAQMEALLFMIED